MNKLIPKTDLEQMLLLNRKKLIEKTNKRVSLNNDTKRPLPTVPVINSSNLGKISKDGNKDKNIRTAKDGKKLNK